MTANLDGSGGPGDTHKFRQVGLASYFSN